MGQAESKQEMFWEACGFGRAHLVEKFIEHGIDVNSVSTVHDYSPIHLASQGKSDVVKLLIDAKCDLSVVDSRGNTALHHASMKGHAEIVEILLSAGADPNGQDKNGWTSLHCAAYYAHLNVVNVLASNKDCDVQLLNKDGRSALVETARSKEHDKERVLGDIARTLIEAGCDVNLKCTDLGEGDFTGLMFAAYHNHVEVAAAFMDGGCDLDAASLCTKWTALHWAADRDNTEMVYLILEAGADPTRTGNRGETASSRAKDEQLKEFLENAVNVFKDLEAIKVAPLSSPHSENAKASLDTAKALETLSSHAKNRDILSTQMPTMPALGIASRSDPKERYVRRAVQEVALKSVAANFPWKSYSKHTSPSPDRDGLELNGVERPKMFPSQDDKTNAFMDSLARRISYMTNKIASMSDDGGGGSREGSVSKYDDSRFYRKNSSSSKTMTDRDCKLGGEDDSGLSSHMATPEDELSCSGGRENGLDTNTNNSSLGENKNLMTSPKKSPLSPGSGSISSSSSPCGKSPSKGGVMSSPSKDHQNHEKLDLEADAMFIEENNRGFTILKALQERRRRSMILEEVVVPPSSPQPPAESGKKSSHGGGGGDDDSSGVTTPDTGTTSESTAENGKESGGSGSAVETTIGNETGCDADADNNVCAMDTETACDVAPVESNGNDNGNDALEEGDKKNEDVVGVQCKSAAAVAGGGVANDEAAAGGSDGSGSSSVGLVGLDVSVSDNNNIPQSSCSPVASSLPSPPPVSPGVTTQV